MDWGTRRPALNHAVRQIESVAGDNWETSARTRALRASRPLGDLETSGDKPEIMWAENGERIQSVVEDNSERSSKSCGPKHSEHPVYWETNGRQA